MPNSEPLSGNNVMGPTGTPVCGHGLDHEVKYKNLSYVVLPDEDVLATDGPLSTNVSEFFPLKPARPDEGDALRLGWLNFSRYVTRVAEDSTKVVSLPQGFSFFVDPGAARPFPVPTGFPVVDTRTTYRYTWHMVPLEAVPINSIIQCRGQVNAATFDGMAAGTALLDGFAYRVWQCVVSDRWYADVTYKVVWAPRYDDQSTTQRGWNSWIRAKDGQARWWPISVDGAAIGGNNRVFRTQNFATLFRPDQTGL